jgi:hypothetical protein
VAEPVPARRERVAREYDLAPDAVFDDWAAERARREGIVVDLRSAS